MVFLITGQFGPGVGGHVLTIHAQAFITAVHGPFCNFVVNTFTPLYQWGQQGNLLPFVMLHDLRQHAVHALRSNGHFASGAMLNAQLHEYQAQEVVHLGDCGYCTFSTTTAGALLDRHRGWDAKNSIHIGLGSRLHKLACVGIQTFKVAALAFGKQNIKCQRRFSAARRPGNYSHFFTRNSQTDVLQVVLARMQNFNAIGQTSAATCRV